MIIGPYPLSTNGDVIVGSGPLQFPDHHVSETQLVPEGGGGRGGGAGQLHINRNPSLQPLASHIPPSPSSEFSIWLLFQLVHAGSGPVIL